MNLNIQQKHMINRQLMPNFIIDENILKIFSVVKREDFLPDKLKNIAYIDDNIFFEDRFMLRTLYLAKILKSMIENSKIRKTLSENIFSLNKKNITRNICNLILDEIN